MSAIRKVANINLIRSLTINRTSLPLPIPIEKDFKPYIEELKELIQIPPPYCPVCNSFLTRPLCNKLIQPKSCPLNSK